MLETYEIQITLQYETLRHQPPEATGWWLPNVRADSQRLADTLLAVANQSSANAYSFYRWQRNDSWDLFWFSENEVAIEIPHRSQAIALKPWIPTPSQSQLWIPLDGAISPPIPETDRESLLSPFTLQIWLPRLGLFRLEESHRTCVESFFQSPRESTSPWQSPPEFIVQFPQIRHLQSASPPDLDTFLSQGNEHIGSAPDRFSQDVAEAGPGLLGRPKRWMLKKLDQWAEKRQQKQIRQSGSTDHTAPPTPRHEHSPGGAMGNVAGRVAAAAAAVPMAVAQAMARRLQGERDQQIEKLLDLMKSDPDRAIRYALPIGGDRNFRGMAFPGSKLLEQLPDFSLSRLGGRGAADQWSIDDRLRARLQQCYYDLMNRAIAAGMHRRAAYIAANLLGDFQLAATTLEAGRHYQEAAALFLDKLHQPKEAARCLSKSGQWEQAVKLYREIGETEMAGDILRDNAKETEAMEAYQDAVIRYQSAGHISESVRLLTTKMNARDSAIQLLWDQWPDGTSPVQSATTAMSMLSADGNHNEIQKRLRWMVDTGGVHSTLDSAKVFRSVATSSPHGEIARLAADACRIAAIRAIESASPMEIEQRMEQIAALSDPTHSAPTHSAPSHSAPMNLLRRDARTFADRARSKPAPPQSVSKGSPGKVLQREKRFSLELNTVVYADILRDEHGEFLLRAIGLDKSGKDSQQLRLTNHSFHRTLSNDLVSHDHLDPIDDLRFTNCSPLPDGISVLGKTPAAKTDRRAPLPKPFFDLRDTPLGVIRDVACVDSGEMVVLRDIDEWERDLLYTTWNDQTGQFSFDAVVNLEPFLQRASRVGSEEARIECSLHDVDHKLVLVAGTAMAHIEGTKAMWLSSFAVQANEVATLDERHSQKVACRG